MRSRSLCLTPYLKVNKPESSRSCRASFKNLGHKFGTDRQTNGQTDGQTDTTRYRLALQLEMEDATFKELSLVKKDTLKINLMIIDEVLVYVCIYYWFH